MSTTTEPRVVDNAAEHRYELLVVDERAGVIEHGTRPGVVELIHTEIDPERQLAKPLNSRGRGNEATAGRSRHVSEGRGTKGNDDTKEQQCQRSRNKASRANGRW